MSRRYYTESLAADRLMRCYAIAHPAARDYLQGEIDFILEELSAGEWAEGVDRARVLELGCGYGRVLQPLLARGGRVWGIDTSPSSLALASALAADAGNPRLAVMDAARLGFAGGCFHAVLCIQNGICVFGVDPGSLLREALRVTRPGGRVFLSSYAARFWAERLAWFEAQAAEGLVGEIDREATGAGVIVCRDGFRAGTFGPEDFRRLANEVGVTARIEEVGGASLFCIVRREA